MQNNCFFFCNRECRFFPCHGWHGRPEDFNCMGCYCPLYSRQDCGGDFAFVKTKSGALVKDCSACLRPHEDFEGIVRELTINNCQCESRVEKSQRSETSEDKSNQAVTGTHLGSELDMRFLLNPIK